MPVEIKELVIRAVVTPGAPADADGASAGGAAPAPQEAAAAASQDGAAPEAMVQDCVRQVLRILARDRER